MISTTNSPPKRNLGWNICRLLNRESTNSTNESGLLPDDVFSCDFTSHMESSDRSFWIFSMKCKPNELHCRRNHKPSLPQHAPDVHTSPPTAVFAVSHTLAEGNQGRVEIGQHSAPRYFFQWWNEHIKSGPKVHPVISPQWVTTAYCLISVR